MERNRIEVDFDQWHQMVTELKALKLQIEETDQQIYKLGLLCDSVPGLQHGFCPDIGEPRDNMTRIGLALKSLKETNRLNGEMLRVLEWLDKGCGRGLGLDVHERIGAVLRPAEKRPDEGKPHGPSGPVEGPGSPNE